MASISTVKKPISDQEMAGREEQWRQELLSRDEIERDYKGITRRWLELAALSGNGPPFVKISARMVRYRRGDFESWLASRTVTSTSQEVAVA